MIHAVACGDALVEVTYAALTSFTSEGSGTATIEVSLDAVSLTDVTVPYAVTGGSATDGTDYTLASGNLIISAGDLTIFT